MRKEETITGRQLFTLVLLAQLGIELLSLPHVMAEVAGRDTWLSVLISGLAAQAGIVLIWWLGSRFPNRNNYAYTPMIIGKPAGALVNLLYGSYYAFSGLLLTLLYADILNRWLFAHTPRWMILLMMLVICAYAATASLKQLANVSQSLFLFPVIGFLLIVFSGIYGLDGKNVLPVLSGGWNPVLKGVYTAYSAYIGYDLLLYAYPYVQTKSKGRLLLVMSMANATTMAFYIAVCLVCSTKFNLNQLMVIPEPIVFILKSYRIEILQSIDILFLIFYVCVVCATIYTYFYLAAKAFGHLRRQGLGKQQLWVWTIAGVCFAGGLFVKKRETVLKMSAVQDQVSLVLVVAVPLILIVAAGLRKVGRGRP